VADAEKLPATVSDWAKHLNVSKAAAELNVTQASVSNRLKGLQKEYKPRLYKKIKRGIELTTAGKPNR